MDLYEYLRTQFTDLEGAKRWACSWFQEHGQELPKHVDDGEVFSMRAMSYHVSMVLENKNPDIKTQMVTNYTSTKYGSEIYSAMMDLPWWKEDATRQHKDRHVPS